MESAVNVILTVIIAVVGIGGVAAAIKDMRLTAKRKRHDQLSAKWVAGFLANQEIQKKVEQSLQSRSDRLRHLLRSTAELMVEIESDIEDAESRAKEIQEKIDRNSPLAALTEAQAQAVQLAMGSTVNEVVNEVVTEVVSESDRRSFWQQLIVQTVLGAMFFALGVVATLLLS